MALFTPSILPPTVHQNLPKPPFVTSGYLSPQTNRNTGFLLSIMFGQHAFVELATPLHDINYIVIYTYIEVII